MGLCRVTNIRTDSACEKYEVRKMRGWLLSYSGKGQHSVNSTLEDSCATIQGTRGQRRAHSHLKSVSAAQLVWRNSTGIQEGDVRTKSRAEIQGAGA